GTTPGTTRALPRRSHNGPPQRGGWLLLAGGRSFARGPGSSYGLRPGDASPERLARPADEPVPRCHTCRRRLGGPPELGRAALGKREAEPVRARRTQLSSTLAPTGPPCGEEGCPGDGPSQQARCPG